MISKAKIPEASQVIDRLQQRIKVARGDQPANLVIRNAKWLDVFTGVWHTGDVAIFEAVAEMINDYFLIRGKNADESRLQRTIETFRKA